MLRESIYSQLSAVAGTHIYRAVIVMIVLPVTQQLVVDMNIDNGIVIICTCIFEFMHLFHVIDFVGVLSQFDIMQAFNS